MAWFALKIAQVLHQSRLGIANRFVKSFSERVDFPTRKNVHTNRGISEAAGVCYCDESTSCRCDPFPPSTERPSELRNASSYRKPGRPLLIRRVTGGWCSLCDYVLACNLIVCARVWVGLHFDLIRGLHCKYLLKSILSQLKTN